MKKTRLLLLLVLLMTAATGAWAQTEELLATITGAGSNTNPATSANVSYSTEGVATLTFSEPTLDGQVAYYVSPAWGWWGYAITLTVTPAEGYTITKCVFYDNDNHTATDSEAPFVVETVFDDKTPKVNGTILAYNSKGITKIEVYGYAKPAATKYNLTLAEGTEDADKWTISPNPAEEGATVTVTYSGERKVKSVKAVKKAAPAEASVPDGAINGKFSVSDGKQVYFSKGNLQATYNGSNWSWAFAEHQWDYIGNAAGNTSINGGGTISENATVDLFGWVGAACAWTGAAQYGISNVKQAAQYGYVEGEALKSDWGTLAITNGGNTANFGWRTLTGGDDSGEWEYLFQTRTTPSGVRYAHATVNSVPGLVLLPDDWSTDYYSLNNVNDANGTAYTDNVISSSDWTSKLEAHGAVFLPAGGNRNAAEVSDAGVGGIYWSSTSSTTVSAIGFRFSSAKFGGTTQGFTRNRGCSVRLVREVATTDAPAKPAATVTTAPTGAAIVGVGKSTELVSGGVADGGTLRYAVTTTNTKPTSTAGFSDAVPTAQTITASGTVYVWYYVKADDTHSDSEIAATAIEVPVADIVWDLMAKMYLPGGMISEIRRGMASNSKQNNPAAIPSRHRPARRSQRSR